MKTNFSYRKGMISSVISKILKGFKASNIIIVNRLSLFYRLLNFFGGAYVTREELGYLYKYLPLSRRAELLPAVQGIAADFNAWQNNYEVNKYSHFYFLEMCLWEMLRHHRSFSDLEKIISLSIGREEIKKAAICSLPAQSQTCKQKIITLNYKITGLKEPGTLIDFTDILVSANDFSSIEEFVKIDNLPLDLKNQGLKKMFSLSVSFEQRVRINRLAQSGSLLRREIAVIIRDDNPGAPELLAAYVAEKTWTNLKHILLGKISELTLDPQDWRDILLCHGDDKKLCRLAVDNLRLVLNLVQWDAILNGAKDPVVKKISFSEMCRAAKQLPVLDKNILVYLRKIAQSWAQKTQVFVVSADNEHREKCLGDMYLLANKSAAAEIRNYYFTIINKLSLKINNEKMAEKAAHKLKILNKDYSGKMKSSIMQISPRINGHISQLNAAVAG